MGLAGVMGGCFIFTLFVQWRGLVSGHPEYSFYLALAAHAQLLVGMTALGAQFVKRTIKAGRDGIEISDNVEGGSKLRRTVSANLLRSRSCSRSRLRWSFKPENHPTSYPNASE